MKRSNIPNERGNYETDSISGLFELANAFYGNHDIKGLEMVENISVHCLKNQIEDKRSDYIAMSEYAEFCIKAIKTRNGAAIKDVDRLRDTISKDLE